MYSIYRKTEQGFIKILDNWNKFTFKLKNEEEFIVKFLTKTEARSEKSHRYLRGGIYTTFVPSMFQNAQEVHEHYGNKFLSRTDFLEVSETERLDEIKNQSRESNGFKITVIVQRKGQEITGHKFRVDWVKSTKALKQKELTIYIDQIIYEGTTEHGLYFENIEDYWKRVS